MCELRSLGQYLYCVLDSYAMRHVAATVRAQARKGEHLKALLAKQYDLKIPEYFPFNSGSILKRTAINAKFDLDIVVPFPYDRFGNLEQMGKSVEDFLETEYKDAELIHVRPTQSWSVGLKFRMQVNGKPEDIRIDVVPGLETSRGGYLKDGQLWLKNTVEGKRLQTNLQRQSDHIANSHDSVLNIVRLLKVWQHNSTGVRVKSFLLELIVVEAFRCAAAPAPKGLWRQLKMVLEFIRERIVNLRLIDPGNSNNHVSDLLPPKDQATLRDTAAKMLSRIQSDPERIRDYFPDNASYCMPYRYE